MSDNPTKEDEGSKYFSAKEGNTYLSCCGKKAHMKKAPLRLA